MQLFKKIGIAVGFTAVAAVSVALAVPATADTGPQGGDAVFVGSDTVQNAVDFVLDGYPGTPGGFNSAGGLNRADNIDATGDANGRATYDGTCGAADSTGTGQFCAATNDQQPNLLGGSVVLRAGTKPVIRPNGSGAGIAALNSDSTTAGYDGLPQYSIQVARASRLPNATEETNCPITTASCGGLHVYQIATDSLGIAHVSSGFDGPSSGLSAAELIGIYQCTTTKWNQLPGDSSGSSATIHPLIPQSGSGTRNFFLADLQTANGGTAITLGSCVRTVEEHDPTGIYADSSPADAIEPFSTGKIALINSGYFANGVNYSGTGEAAGAYTPGYLTTFPAGTAGDGNAAYVSSRGLYLVVRQVDVTSSSIFEPGGTQNYTTALITSGASAFRSAAGKAYIADAGFTPAYKDCGINPTTC